MNVLLLILIIISSLSTITFGFKSLRSTSSIKTKYIKQSASSGLDVLEESSNDITSNTKSNNDIIEKTITTNNIINDNEISTEILSGLTVALATVPTSIAYATIVGISPLLGIWTSILIGGIVGLTLSITPKYKFALTSKYGSGPGLIAGAAGVVAIPLAKLSNMGLTSYLGTTVVMASLIEILLAVFRTGKLANEVPEPVISGFLNTFALFLVQSQLKVFKYGGLWLPQADMINALFVAITCATSIKLLPKITKKIPAALGGLLVSTGLVKILNLPVQSLADLAAKSGSNNIFSGGLSSFPSLSLPILPNDIGIIQTLLPTAIGIALISVIETLLAAKIAARSSKGGGDDSNIDPDQLMVGLGLGNAASSLIGGIGGCGLIPNTILNKSTGGKGSLSAISYSIVLTAILILFAPALGSVPMPALAGLMFIVAFNTFEWHETKSIIMHAWEERTLSNQNKQKYFDLIGLFVTMWTCYSVDMGVGIVLGVAVTRVLDILNWIKSKLKR